MKQGQKNSITHLDGPLLICAGAGSGKTFTLTQRIAWALLPGSGADGKPFLDNVDQALVITFTNKAAGEIKDRVRRTLRAEGLADQALKVDGAWISTIHGMCSRILREHALEQGLDPAFTLAMDAECETARAQAIDQAIRQARAQDRNPYALLFEQYDTDRVREMVGTLLTQAGYQTAGLDAVNLGPSPRPLHEYVAALLEECAAIQEVGTEKNRLESAQLADKLNQVLMGTGTNGETATALLDALQSVNRNNLRGKKADGLRNLLNQVIAVLQLDATRPVMDQLLALCHQVEGIYQALLAQQGALDTSDLIRATLRMFEEHPDIAASYTERFKLIMVDEFQDTSQLQIDMINRIAGENKHHLCTVGDAQQSIYRFQGADVEVYLQHKQEMLGDAVGAHQEQLVDNFRSHGDVLALTRRICGQPGYFSEDFLDLQAATTGKTWHAACPRIEMALTEYPKGVSVDDAAHAEAALIAQRFSTLRAAGHRARDMVILMGSTSKSEIYAQALRSVGLPCVVAGGSKFFERAHVAVCLALLNVLVNPNDSESLLTVLTSDLLPVSSDDLLWLATYHNDQQRTYLRQNPALGLLVPQRAPKHASPLLQHAHTVLTHAWENLGTVRPRALFEQVIVESGWLGRLQKQGAEGQAVAADLFKFARLIDDAAREHGNDLGRVTQQLVLRAQLGKEKPGALTVSDADAVRIMTVHSSKGLAFPIVAVTDCYVTRADTDQPRTLADAGTLYTALSPNGFKMPKSIVDEVDFAADDAAALLHNAPDACTFLQAIKTANQEREYAEKKRLFYVAITRASDAVLVCLKHGLDKNGAPTGYKQVEADILQGLFPGQADFPHDSGTFEYGGSEPGTFTRQTAHKSDSRETEEAAGNAVHTEDEGAAHDENAALSQSLAATVNTDDGDMNRNAKQASEAPAGTDSAANAGIEIPLPPAPTHIPTVPTNTRSGLFSYSSIAPADHGTTMAVADTSNRYESYENEAPNAAADADKATSFGSALHQTCEWMALHAQEPNAEDIEGALRRFARQWDVHDLDRLRRAVTAWAQSDLCHHAFACRTHQPEVPFQVAVGGNVLEGSIDLFCTGGKANQPMSDTDKAAVRRALVIDYKTGGSAAETPEQLYRKHLLQAQCYAFAVLSAGYRCVSLRFVRVEQLDSTGQPQTVSYELDASDLPALSSLISRTARTKD